MPARTATVGRSALLGTYAAPMSENTSDADRAADGGEELKDDDQGAGIGFDDEPNTFEPEEDPEAAEPK